MSDEVVQKITEILSELSERLARIEEKLKHVPMCGASCAQNNTKDLDRRIAAIENYKTWLERIVIGAVVLSLLGLVIIKQ